MKYLLADTGRRVVATGGPSHNHLASSGWGDAFVVTVRRLWRLFGRIRRGVAGSTLSRYGTQNDQNGKENNKPLSQSGTLTGGQSAKLTQNVDVLAPAIHGLCDLTHGRRPCRDCGAI